MILQDLKTLLDIIVEAVNMLRVQLADPANGPFLAAVVVALVVIIGLAAYFWTK